MALTVQHFNASTINIAEKALQKGYLKYPGICYIQDGNYLIWITKENKLDLVGGYNQITKIDYKSGKLCFMSGDNVLYEADTTMTPEVADEIKNDIVKNLDLNQYAKSDDVANLVDSKIGNLGNKANVIEYISELSYDSLLNLPIINLYGSLTKTIVLTFLEDGVYKVSGQFMIGGNHTTIQMSSDDSIFIVARNKINNSIYITHLLCNSIKTYTILENGDYLFDSYITESYLKNKDFITSGEVKEYVKVIVKDAIVETIDMVLDDRLDITLGKKISGIPSEDIVRIFNRKE